MTEIEKLKQLTKLLKKNKCEYFFYPQKEKNFIYLNTQQKTKCEFDKYPFLFKRNKIFTTIKNFLKNDLWPFFNECYNIIEWERYFITFINEVILDIRFPFYIENKKLYPQKDSKFLNNFLKFWKIKNEKIKIEEPLEFLEEQIKILWEQEFKDIGRYFGLIPYFSKEIYIPSLFWFFDTELKGETEVPLISKIVNFHNTNIDSPSPFMKELKSILDLMLNHKFEGVFKNDVIEFFENKISKYWYENIFEEKELFLLTTKENINPKFIEFITKILRKHINGIPEDEEKIKKAAVFIIRVLIASINTAIDTNGNLLNFFIRKSHKANLKIIEQAIFSHFAAKKPFKELIVVQKGLTDLNFGDLELDNVVFAYTEPNMISFRK